MLKISSQKNVCFTNRNSFFLLINLLIFVKMSKTKSCPRSYKRNIVVELSKRKKDIMRTRKACWKNLFHKYSQPVSNDIEINIATLMPEGCNISENKISKDKISTDIEFESTEKVETNVTYKKDVNEACRTRIIWSIGSTGLLVTLINIASNKIISIKKKSVEDTTFISNTELKESKNFVIQTQAFDCDSD